MRTHPAAPALRYRLLPLHLPHVICPHIPLPHHDARTPAPRLMPGGNYCLAVPLQTYRSLLLVNAITTAPDAPFLGLAPFLLVIPPSAGAPGRVAYRSPRCLPRAPALPTFVVVAGTTAISVTPRYRYATALFWIRCPLLLYRFVPFFHHTTAFPSPHTHLLPISGSFALGPTAADDFVTDFPTTACPPATYIPAPFPPPPPPRSAATHAFTHTDLTIHYATGAIC